MKQETKVPRGVRNNNPFNIRFSPTNDWKGKITENKSDDMFEEFSSLEYGVRAWCILIKTYVKKHHCSTLRSIVYRFAPVSENDTLSYYKYVKEAVGSLAVDPFSNVFLFRLACSMWYVENGVIPTHHQASQISLGINIYLKDYSHEMV